MFSLFYRESKPPQAQDISNPYQFQSSTRGSASPTPPAYIHNYQQQHPTLCQPPHTQGAQEPTPIPQLPIAPPPPASSAPTNDNDTHKTCPTSPVPQPPPRKRTLSMQLNASPIHQHDEIHARGIRSSTIQPISPEEEPDRKRKKEDHSSTKQPLESNNNNQQQPLSTTTTPS